MSEQEQSDAGVSELELLKNRARLIGVEFSNNIGLATLKERIAAKMSEIGSDSDDSNGSDQSQNQNEDQGQSEQNEDTEGSQGSQSQSFDDEIEDEPEVVEPVEETNGFKAAAAIADAKISRPASPDQVIQKIKPLAPKTVTPSAGGKLGTPIAAAEGQVLTLRQHLYNEQMKLVRLQITNLDPKKGDLQGELLAVANKYLGTVKMFVPYGEVTDDGWHVPYIIYKELERRRFLSIRTTKDRKTGQVKVNKSWAKEFSLVIMDPLSTSEIERLAVAQAAAGSIDGPSEVL